MVFISLFIVSIVKDIFVVIFKIGCWSGEYWFVLNNLVWRLVFKESE